MQHLTNLVCSFGTFSLPHKALMNLACRTIVASRCDGVYSTTADSDFEDDEPQNTQEGQGCDTTAGKAGPSSAAFTLIADVADRHRASSSTDGTVAEGPKGPTPEQPSSSTLSVDPASKDADPKDADPMLIDAVSQKQAASEIQADAAKQQEPPPQQQQPQPEKQQQQPEPSVQQKRIAAQAKPTEHERQQKLQRVSKEAVSLVLPMNAQQACNMAWGLTLAGRCTPRLWGMLMAALDAAVLKEDRIGGVPDEAVNQIFQVRGFRHNFVWPST